MTPALSAWVSPFDTYQSVGELVADAQRVHLPGMETRVLLPTMYGDSYQLDIPRGSRRALGDALCARTAAGYATIRAQIEAEGTPCDGWSVPVAPDGDCDGEGYRHGLVAAAFDRFVVNLEHGWSQFWSQDGTPIITDWLTGYWRGLQDAGAADRLNGNVGLTIVTNTSMMNALDDDELREWTGGTNYDCLEAYVPGDAGLDPSNALRIWGERLARLGILGRAVVVILEQGDLPALAQQYGDPWYGVHLWTLQTAARQTWPADAPAPVDPCADVQAQRDGLINSMGVIGGDLLRPVARLKLAAQPKAVQALVAGIRTQCDREGIAHV